ncbi:cupredoxin domain-containing protein [Leucobacter sp. 1207-22]|uniref:cupredoxin domain-containing protein n=1 Tax=Leucobacter sp. 1207-22 TaxID=2604456 RepID=UPI00406383B9
MSIDQARITAGLSRRNFVTGVLGVAAATAGTLALSGCVQPKPPVVPSNAPSGVKPVVQISVIDNEYSPAEVTVRPGDAVEWIFEGHSADHDVVADDGSFVSELMREGSYVFVFEKAGTFGYDCSIHPEMRGTVTVA